MARALLRGLRGRRRVSQPARPDDLRGRQCLVHLSDAEHEPDSLQRPLRRAHPVRAAAREQCFHARARHGNDRPRHERERRRQPGVDGHQAAETRLRRRHDLGGERDPRRPRVEVQPERRHRHDALPWHQPAKRGRDRVQTDVHALQARRPRGCVRLPGYRHGMERVTMATAAERLAAFGGELAYEETPASVVEAAKPHLLDCLGCGLAAAGLGIATGGCRALAEIGGEPQATVIGLDARLPAVNAAFANAMLCHGLDFDDTHSDSVSHVSVVVCPAALGAGEAAGASGREVLTAIVAGNEVVTRVGMAASGAFHQRGFHPTAICGIFGGTIAASRLAGYDAAQTVSALGIAGSFAGGLFAYLEDGTATKPMHPAWAAHGALLATRLASLGAEGPPSVIEGRFGLYHAFVGAQPGDVDIDSQLGDLGRRWETTRIAYKPYPACHFIHGSLGATGTLAGELDPEEIEDIVVSIPEAGVTLVLEPEESKKTPRTEYEA